MTFQATVYRILIVSPNDVLAERKIIQEIIASWNRTCFPKMKALLLPAIWEELFIIERYILDWTREKNSKPTNFDDGKQILEKLKREILSLRVSLVEIFSKDVMKNIAEIISKIDILQKYRSYLDPKSIRDFWKKGDEIFSSLDSVAGKVRKDLQGHTHSKD